MPGVVRKQRSLSTVVINLQNVLLGRHATREMVDVASVPVHQAAKITVIVHKACTVKKGNAPRAVRLFTVVANPAVQMVGLAITPMVQSVFVRATNALVMTSVAERHASNRETSVYC